MAEARKLNAERHTTKEPGSEDRDLYGVLPALLTALYSWLSCSKVAGFLPFLKKTYAAMANETALVGWFLVGGVDEHGKIVAVQCVLFECAFSFVFTLTVSNGTAVRENETFEQYLAKCGGWSVDRLRTVFDDFFRDIFDRKR